MNQGGKEHAFFWRETVEKLLFQKQRDLHSPQSQHIQEMEHVPVSGLPERMLSQVQVHLACRMLEERGKDGLFKPHRFHLGRGAENARLFREFEHIQVVFCQDL